MLWFGILVIIIANACLLVNIRLFKLFLIRILLYDLLALAIFLTLVLYQESKPPNYITTNSGKKYTIDELSNKKRTYIDRVYRFTKVPAELSGAILIQTANDDKGSNQQNLFSLTINQGQEAIIYYFFDKRLYSQQAPGWLGHKKTQPAPGLVSTDKDVTFVMVTDTIRSESERLFFGGNRSASEKTNNDPAQLCSMYLVAIKGVRPDQVTNTRSTEKEIFDFPVLVSGCDSLLLSKKAREGHLKWLRYGPGFGKRLDLSGVKQIEGVRCYNGDFNSVDLSKISIDSSEFNSTTLNNAEFSNSRFNDVHFFNTNIDSANFAKATLTNCSFLGSDLRGAIFIDANLNEVSFACANMAGVILEPDTLTDVEEIAGAYNLDSVTYRTNPGALIKLRGQLKAEGFSRAQREITAAIERRKFQLNNSFANMWITYLLFGFTSDYGLNQLQPLMMMLSLIYLFYRTYLFLFFIGWLEVDIKHKQETHEGNIVVVKDSIQPGRLLFLSIITSFSIGFGPYNLNDWARKLLKEDYTLESRGWTRILIGVQNLVSLYLFALTVLLLFGDPFNF